MVRQRVEPGCDLLLRRCPPWLGLMLPERHDLLHRPHRQPFGHDAVGQAILFFRVGQRQQRPGMTCAQHARRNPALHLRGKLKQPDRVRDVRPRPPHLARKLVMCGRKIVEQLLVGGGLFQRVELFPVQVLHEGLTEQLVVGSAAHDGRDVLQAGQLTGTPAALTHDQLEVARHDLPHHDRLEQADLTYRERQFLQRILVKVLPWLPRVRSDRTDSDLVEIGPIDLLRLPHTNDGTTQRCASGIAGMALQPGRPRRRGYQRPQPSAESPLLLSHLISSHCRHYHAPSPLPRASHPRTDGQAHYPIPCGNPSPNPASFPNPPNRPTHSHPPKVRPATPSSLLACPDGRSATTQARPPSACPTPAKPYSLRAHPGRPDRQDPSPAPIRRPDTRRSRALPYPTPDGPTATTQALPPVGVEPTLGTLPPSTGPSSATAELSSHQPGRPTQPRPSLSPISAPPRSA